MVASSIIGYLVSTLKFKQNKNDTNDPKSFYKEIPIGVDKMVVIRISDHRTYLQTWADNYPKNLQPSKKIVRRMGGNLPIKFRRKTFYSFVFEDKPSQNDISVKDGRIITVYESVKQAQDIKDDRQLMLIGNALSNFITNQEQYDEQILGKLQPITNKIQENKQYRNTNNTVMKINESQLRKIIQESVQSILRENYEEYSPVWDMIEDMKQYISVEDILARLISKIGPDAAVRHLQDIKTVEIDPYI